MKKEWILVPIACLALLIPGWAEAQGASRIKRSGTRARVPVATPNRAPRSVAPRGMVSARRPSGRTGISPQRGATVPGFRGANRGTAPARGYNPLGGNTRGGGALGDILQQYLNNGYGGRRQYDPYAGEKAHAKAYRDAAIANAVVNVVGILATNHQQRRYGSCTTPPAPRGHVERQRVLVHEGRTEEYQVWVPTYTIASTGERVLGHHETRRRDIAPVYEEREVWIPTP